MRVLTSAPGCPLPPALWRLWRPRRGPLVAAPCAERVFQVLPARAGHGHHLNLPPWVLCAASLAFFNLRFRVRPRLHPSCGCWRSLQHPVAPCRPGPGKLPAEASIRATGPKLLL